MTQHVPYPSSCCLVTQVPTNLPADEAPLATMPDFVISVKEDGRNAKKADLSAQFAEAIATANQNQKKANVDSAPN